MTLQYKGRESAIGKEGISQKKQLRLRKIKKEMWSIMGSTMRDAWRDIAWEDTGSSLGEG